MKSNRGNKAILVSAYFFMAIMLYILGNFIFLLLFKAEDVINNPYNKRSAVIENKVLRGNIYSADNKLLATTIENEDGTVTRFYPYGEIYAHVIGRYDKGKTGIESSHNFELLRVDKYSREVLKNEIYGIRSKGYDVVTTLDSTLSSTAYDLLGDKKGAIVIIEPKTGRILTMVSAPSYDPNTIIDDWDELVDENNKEVNSSLLNRVVNGLYPPGSTFKIVMAMEYIMENKNEYDKYTFYCDGKTQYEKNNISCYNNKRHKTVDLYKSLAYSCNTSFSNIAMNVDLLRLKDLCEALGYNKALENQIISFTPGSFELNKDSTQWDIIQTSIGQGKTTITPFQNALIMCAIANDGKLVYPYVASELIDDQKNVVKDYKSGKTIELIDSYVAGEIKELLKGVVEIGTANSLKSNKYQVFGKTGSAEYGIDGKAHGWFVGCVQSDEKESIVITVLVEDGKTGKESAVPIAKELIEIYMGQ